MVGRVASHETVDDMEIVSCGRTKVYGTIESWSTDLADYFPWVRPSSSNSFREAARSDNNYPSRSEVDPNVRVVKCKGPPTESPHWEGCKWP